MKNGRSAAIRHHWQCEAAELPRRARSAGWVGASEAQPDADAGGRDGLNPRSAATRRAAGAAGGAQERSTAVVQTVGPRSSATKAVQLYRYSHTIRILRVLDLVLTSTRT